MRRPSGDRASLAGQGGRSAPAGSRINLEAVMAQPDALDPSAVDRALGPGERSVLRILLLHPRLIAEHPGRSLGDLFVTTPARELLQALERVVTGADLDRAAFVASLEPTLAVVAQTLMARSDPVYASDDEAGQALEQSILTLERAQLRAEFEYVRGELADAQASGDEQLVDRLQQRVLELQRRRLELDRAVEDTSLLAKRRIRPTQDRTTTEVTHGD
jgi:hypothetical protein